MAVLVGKKLRYLKPMQLLTVANLLKNFHSNNSSVKNMLSSSFILWILLLYVLQNFWLSRINWRNLKRKMSQWLVVLPIPNTPIGPGSTRTRTTVELKA